MGAFVDGIWREGDFPHDTTGHFVRPDAPFRNWITASGEPGPSGAGGFRGGARPLSPLRVAGLPLGAFHLDHARAQGSRADHPGLCFTNWLMAEQGWTFPRQAKE